MTDFVDPRSQRPAPWTSAASTTRWRAADSAGVTEANAPDPRPGIPTPPSRHIDPEKE